LMQEAQSGAPNPGLVYAIMNAHQQTAALKAAIDLDVFGAVGKGLGDAASIAQHCSASERGIRVLCDFLVISGLLRKEDGRYRHTPTSAVFLDPASPASMASVAGFLSNPMIREVYANLAEIVRSGRTTLPGSGTVEPDNPLWVDFAEKMVPMTGPMAAPMAATVLEGVSGPLRVLDIAAGHGLFGIEIAKQNPEARITGLDWAAVLEVSHRNAHKAGVGDRYEKLPGSAFDVEFGGPYDVVLLTNFLHHFDRATCVGLLKKIHAALRPGGRVATLDFVPDEGKVSPPPSAGFAMTMLTSTEAGDVYTLAELTSMYKEAGFGEVKGIPIPMSPETVVLGRA
jgi:ubiquinone/menaquinone biosynthesis C-methylase UbiE